MSHTNSTLSKTSTTRGRGSRSRTRGQGRGNENLNRGLRNTYGNSTIPEFNQYTESNNFDNWENRTPNHFRRGYFQENRGKNNSQKKSKDSTGYFKLDNFPRSSEPIDGLGANGNRDASRLPKHASNPIFVRELMHRFSSILPESDLLEPEPDLVQQRGFQTENNEHRHASNLYFNNMPVVNSEYSMKKSAYSNNSKFCTKGSIGTMDEVSNGNAQRENGRYQTERNYSKIRNNDSNRYDNNSVQRKSHKSQGTLGTQFFETQIEEFHPGHGKPDFTNHPRDCIESKKPINASEKTTKPIKNSTSNYTFTPQNSFTPAATNSSLKTQFRADLNQIQSGFNEPGSDSNDQKDRSTNKSTNSIKETENQIKSSLNVSTPYPHDTLSASSSSSLGSQFLADLDLFQSGLQQPASNLDPFKDGISKTASASTPKLSSEEDLRRGSNKCTNSFAHTKQSINSNQNKDKINSTLAQTNKPCKKTCSVDIPENNCNYSAGSIGSSAPESFKQSSLTQNHRHLIQSRPSCSMVACEELALTGREVSGAGPFNIVRPLADYHEAPVRRSEAINNIEKKYEADRKEYEKKKKEKEEKKIQEKLRRYNYVDNGHQGYRMNEGYLDEAAGFAPEIAFESVEERVVVARERQQLQLQIDSILYQERKEKELAVKKKQEEEKLKEKLANNKHIDGGHKLGTGPASGFGILPAVNTVERPVNANKKQQKTTDASKPKPIKLEEKQSEMDNKSKFVDDVKSKQGYKPKPVAFGGGEGVKNIISNESNDDVKLVEEEERLRQEALFFQQQARMAEEKLKELNKRRKKNNEHEEKMCFEACNVTQSVQCSAAAPTVRGEALKLRQTSLKSENVDTEQAVIKSKANSELEILETPSSGVLKRSKKGFFSAPVLVIRPSPSTLQQAMATRIELQDEFDKLGHSDLYSPNIHPVPEFVNNRFESCLTLPNKKSTGAIPKKPLQTRNVIEPAKSATIDIRQSEVVNASSSEPVIDHQAELRAARLRMQLKYEQQLLESRDQN